MWKPGSTRSHTNKSLAAIWLVVLLGSGTACAGSPAATTVPTQVLIPATITDTPTPLPPTATPAPLPGPQDILSSPNPVLIPAAAQSLVSDVISDLATTLEIDRGQITLVRVEAVTWTSRDLGCRTSNRPNLEQAIAGYHLVLLVGDAVYEYHTDSGTTFRRCGAEGVNVGETNLLADIDPIAGELVALAQRRVSEELDVSTGRVRVVEVKPYTWPDTSLGCPRSGEDYTHVEIDGYRIILSVGGEFFAFHTDFDRLIPCELGSEALPDAEGD